MSGSAPDRQRHEEIRFETSDVRARPILLGTAGIGALALASFLAMWGLFHALADREARESAQPNPLAERYGRRQPPEPRLQTHPRDDLLALQRSEQAVLDGYGWIDRERGTVRIPVERAMEILARRGLPARIVLPERESDD